MSAPRVRADDCRVAVEELGGQVRAVFRRVTDDDVVTLCDVQGVNDDRDDLDTMPGRLLAALILAGFTPATRDGGNGRVCGGCVCRDDERSDETGGRSQTPTLTWGERV